nr:translation initiation factor IF-2-like [Pongo abelii]
MTPFAVVPVSVELGAFCCGWEVGRGEGVGRGGRKGEDSHRCSLVRRAGRCCHSAPLDVTASRAPPPRVGGKGGGGPRASASPGPRRPPCCGGEGRLAATAADGGGGPRAFGASLEGAEPSAPASPRPPGGGVHGPGSRRAWGRDAVGRFRDCPAAAARRLLSPPRFPSSLPGLKAAKLRLREKRENCNPCLQPD